MLEFQKFDDHEPTVLESPTFSGLLILSETFRKKMFFMFIGYPDFHFEIPKILLFWATRVKLLENVFYDNRIFLNLKIVFSSQSKPNVLMDFKNNLVS